MMHEMKSKQLIQNLNANRCIFWQIRISPRCFVTFLKWSTNQITKCNTDDRTYSEKKLCLRNWMRANWAWFLWGKDQVCAEFCRLYLKLALNLKILALDIHMHNDSSLCLHKSILNYFIWFLEIIFTKLYAL